MLGEQLSPGEQQSRRDRQQQQPDPHARMPNTTSSPCSGARGAPESVGQPRENDAFSMGSSISTASAPPTARPSTRHATRER
jgi:hypothetical protein